MAVYKNITTTTTTDLISKGGDQGGRIVYISICNVDSLAAENISVFLEDAAASESTDAGNNKYFFIKDVDIPVGATLVLNTGLSFNSDLYNLRITTNNDGSGGAPSLSIIIK
jgi:hypothetical protein